MPLTMTWRNVRTTLGLLVFCLLSEVQAHSLVETVSWKSPTAKKASSTAREARHTEYKNEMLRPHLVALAATKTHLAKIYLFDQEYKSYLGKEHLRNLKCGV